MSEIRTVDRATLAQLDRPAWLLGVVAALAMVVIGTAMITGCGGGSSSSDTVAAAEASSETGSAKKEPPASEAAASTEEGPLGPLSEKLAEHGFRGTAVQPGKGPVEWHISAEPKSGPPTIEVSYYGDAASAQKEGKEIEGIYANHAGLVYVNGRLMIQVGAEKSLPSSTEEAFAEVEADAEGLE